MNSDIRNADLNLLYTLKVLLEEKNVSRAAERLALTQPTVSGMLGRLRDMFDDPLFVRTRHGLVPTPRAESLIAELDSLVGHVEKILKPTAFNPGTMKKEFRVSTNDYMQHSIILPLIREMRVNAPVAKLAVKNMETLGIERSLASGEIDLAITTPDFITPQLHSTLLYREEYVCVVGKNHPIKSGKVSMNRFLAFPHALMSPSEAQFAGPTDDALSNLNLKREVLVSVPSFYTLVEALQGDELIGVVPRKLFDAHTGKLRIIKPPLNIQGFDVIAAWHARTHRDEAHQWFRKQLTSLSHSR